MSTLERAIVIAAEGHAGVKDKGGAPYTLHPLRMMLTLFTRRKHRRDRTYARIVPHGHWTG